ncbi:MAG: alpha-L-rhamnosidase N-terminal domain-containing protein, partial [Oscillospiraceae bacterium]|nr:alpha-L-rhamnosidase N-terminal domain-containing protein [Oscillospiraceae bacterium]
MRAIHLQTEYLTEPLGLGIIRPRFYWNCEGGTIQSAYQITCKRGEEVVWDSGKVPSASMTHIRYAGQPLGSRDRIDWSVRLWDENDEPGESSESWFELGLLEASDWTAKWISGDYRPEKNHRYPVDCFRRDFRAEKKLRRGRIYASACGLYELHLNGQRVGDGVLLPGNTDLRRRIQYQSFDITDLLTEDNRLTAVLADGWYRGIVGAFGPRNVYCRQTKLLV